MTPSLIPVHIERVYDVALRSARVDRRDMGLAIQQVTITLPIGTSHGEVLMTALEKVVTYKIAVLEERLKTAEAQVIAAREFGTAMLGFCSPHGVATGYGQRLLDGMDEAAKL